MSSVVNVVIDNGSRYTKIGFANNKRPESIFPTTIYTESNTNYIGQKGLTQYNNSAKQNGESLDLDPFFSGSSSSWPLRYPVERGTINNWDDIEKIWDYSFSHKLSQTRSEDSSVLYVYSATNPKEDRERLAQIFFERFETCAFFIGSSEVMNMYSLGLATGISVDIGASVARIAPVKEGHTVIHASETLNLGGSDITNYLLRQMMDKKFSELNGNSMETNSGEGSSSQIQEKKINFDLDKLKGQCDDAERNYLEQCKKELEELDSELNENGEESVTHSEKDERRRKKKQKKVLKNLRFRNTYELVDQFIKPRLSFTPIDLDDAFEKLVKGPPTKSSRRSSGLSSSAFAPTSENKWDDQSEYLQNFNKYNKFVLPDGNEIQIFPDENLLEWKRILFNSGELLLQPNVLVNSGYELGIHELIFNCIQNCNSDVNLKKELYANVVLSGGAAKGRGWRDRLETELKGRAPVMMQVSVKGVEHKRYGAWSGASMLAGLPSFEEMWMTKVDYDEFGPSAINRLPM